MEVKITTKMLADRMLANYKETEHLLCASAEIELTRLLGRDFVEEAFTLAKNSIVGGKLFCKNCRHCHPLYVTPDMSTPSLAHGRCDLLMQKVRLLDQCKDVKKGGAE